MRGEKGEENHWNLHISYNVAQIGSELGWIIQFVEEQSEQHKNYVSGYLE